MHGHLTTKVNRQFMTRYLLFLILGLTLGLFILMTAPANSIITDMCGLLLLSYGIAKFLTSRQTAGILTIIGLAVILHVITAWWFNYLALGQDYGGHKVLTIYSVLTLLFLTLGTISILSIRSDTFTSNKLDSLVLRPNMTRFLQTLPIVLMLIEIGICYFFL